MKKITKILLILLSVLLTAILILYIALRPPRVSYWNSSPNFYYLATENKLYILGAIQKIESQESLIASHFDYSIANQLLYLLVISKDGSCKTYSFVPPEIMASTITVLGINLARYNDGLVLFDAYARYFFDGNSFGKVPPDAEAKLSKVIAEVCEDLNRKPLEEWNKAHGVIAGGEVDGNFFGEKWKLDWQQHHFEFSNTELSPQCYQITISAPSLWASELCLKIPFDRLPYMPHPKQEPGFGNIEADIPVSQLQQVAPATDEL